MKRTVRAMKSGAYNISLEDQCIVITEDGWKDIPATFEISWDEPNEISHLHIDEGIDMRMTFIKKVNELVTAVNELRRISRD